MNKKWTKEQYVDKVKNFITSVDRGADSRKENAEQIKAFDPVAGKLHDAITLHEKNFADYLKSRIGDK